jgi:PPOX class probable F420-dependent enzyme
VALDDDIRRLATGRNFAAFTTLFADGRPQTHIMWVDADEDHLLINTEIHRAKFRNVDADPRVTVTIWDAADAYRYAEVRGRVTDVVTGPEALAHIHACAQRYFGRPYPNEVASERAILRITPDRIHRNGL